MLLKELVSIGASVENYTCLLYTSGKESNDDLIIGFDSSNKTNLQDAQNQQVIEATIGMEDVYKRQSWERVEEMLYVSISLL